jgi:hypothetical protein
MTTTLAQASGNKENERIVKELAEEPDELKPAIQTTQQEMTRDKAFSIVTPENIREVGDQLSVMKATDVSLKMLKEGYDKEGTMEHSFAVDTYVRNYDGEIERRTVVANTAATKLIDEYSIQDTKNRSLVIASQLRPYKAIGARLNQLVDFGRVLQYAKEQDMTLDDFLLLHKYGLKPNSSHTTK